MAEENAVKANADSAANQEGVKVEPKAQEPVEVESQVKELNSKIEKLTKERDNYRTGLLKAKGKIQGEDGEPEESEDERIRRIVREENLSSELLRLNQEKDAIIERTARENKELKVALQNRSNVSGVPSGGSQDKPEAKSNSYLSDAQKEELRNRFSRLGHKPEVVEKMILDTEARMRSKGL